MRSKVVLASVLVLLVVGLVGTKAQEQGSNPADLTLKDVKDRLKENKRHLEDAKTRGKAGDAQGLETALASFERGTEGLNRALAAGRFQGTEAEREEAFERVEQATRKHTQVLEGLLSKVPEQARPHIEHAMAVSQKGHDTALAHLDEARARRQAAEAQGRMPGRPGTFGRPGEMSTPGGAGRHGAPGAAGAGAGRPAGGSGRRGPGR